MPNYDGFTVTHYHEVVAADDTDEELIAAITGHRIVVVQLAMHSGATNGSDVTFESDGAADTVLLGPIEQPVDASFILPYSRQGWFRTNLGEALIVTTGAGSDTSILLGYVID